MLRIVVEDAGEGRAVIRLEGQIIGPWVGELERVCEPIVARGIGLQLDLSTVSFVSREGIEFLSRLGDHARLTNCSRFVAEQLKAGAAGARASGARAPRHEEDRS